MNHLRIYESYRGDKIKKSYQNSILYKYAIDYDLTKARLETQKKEILDLLNEYVEMNRNYLSNKYHSYYLFTNDKITNYEFIINNKSICQLSLIYNPYSEIILKYDDIENLLKFLEDPDLYRNSKKYNI